MSKEMKTQPELLEVAVDGTWIWSCAGKKYRLREADVDQLRISGGGQDLTILLKLVTEEETADGKWKPFEWPKGGVHRLFGSLTEGYMRGLGSIDGQVKKSLMPTSGKTSLTETQQELIRP